LKNRLAGLTGNKYLTNICFNSFWRWKLLYLFHQNILSSRWSFKFGNTKTRHMGVCKGGEMAFPLLKLGLRSKNFLKTRNQKCNSD